jgi:hypothetical protein
LEEELGFAAFKFGASFPNEHPMRYVITRTRKATGDGLGSVDGPSSSTDFVIIVILIDTRISLEVFQTEPAVAYLLFYLHCNLRRVAVL